MEGQTSLNTFLNTNVQENVILSKEESDGAWPKLKVPYSSEIRSKVYTYDWEHKQLEPFKDMTSRIYVDSEGNRALFMLDYQVTFKGMERSNIYVDFNNGWMVKSINDLDFC